MKHFVLMKPYGADLLKSRPLALAKSWTLSVLKSKLLSRVAVPVFASLALLSLTSGVVKTDSVNLSGDATRTVALLLSQQIHSVTREGNRPVLLPRPPFSSRYPT